jgi:hypothetical protein
VGWGYRRSVQFSGHRLLGAVAGVAVGLVAAAVLILGGSFDGRVTPVVVPDASPAFIAAFQRSLEGTYAVEADYTRTLSDGRTLKSNVFVAQRPPDSIRRQFGGIAGTVAGHTVSCSAEVGGQFHCSASRVAPDSAATINQEMANLRTYFASPALYLVARSTADCFKLTQNRPAVTLPYGSAATFCFDRPTGAVRILTQRLEGATDRLEATLVRGEVTAADFDLAENVKFGVQTDGAGVDDATAPSGAGDTGTSGG